MLPAQKYVYMKQEITKLTGDCLDYFNSNSYSQTRIDQYLSMWKRGILSYMKEKDLSIYTSDVGEDFIDSFIKEDSITVHERDMVRSVHVLTDFLHLGYARKRTFTPVEYPLNGEIGQQMQSLINHLHSLRRDETTVKVYQLYLSRFLTFLEYEQVKTVSGIKERHVLKFISTMENNKVNVRTCIRVLFRYWREQHVTEEDFLDLFDNFKCVKPEKIPSYYMASEVSVIEKTIDRCSGVGKRNYAMLLLASRLGLRASDIISLKFHNIDWQKNEIHLNQYKTEHPVVLPLLSDVGNAIIDYLQHGRFKSESRQIFLSARAPYVPATRNMVCSAISRTIQKSGLSIENRRHGSHAMRHSLASRLLENSVSIHVISGVLGHKNTESTMPYLRIDISSLLKCSLPVPPVSGDFYMQKGGMFYE